MEAAGRIAVLISGEGSNLQAIIDACARGFIPGRILCVISNRPDARGLQRARAAGLDAIALPPTADESRAAYDGRLIAAIDGHDVELVVLAGFMRILSAEFVRHYHGRLLNIHPSLLPKYPGLHTHRRALAAGDAEHGATVHFVTEALDSGPAVLHARVRIAPDDDEYSLSARVQAEEHKLYPLAIRWFSQGRLRQTGGQAVLDGRALPAGGLDLAALADEQPEDSA